MNTYEEEILTYILFGFGLWKIDLPTSIEYLFSEIKEYSNQENPQPFPTVDLVNWQDPVIEVLKAIDLSLERVSTIHLSEENITMT